MRGRGEMVRERRESEREVRGMGADGGEGRGETEPQPQGIMGRGRGGKDSKSGVRRMGKSMEGVSEWERDSRQTRAGAWESGEQEREEGQKKH